jgi:hypothetical protein
VRRAIVVLIVVGLASACATGPPTGPSVMVLPGTGKTFEQFQADDAACRQWAAQSVGTPGGAGYGSAQRAYDVAYQQCMYAKGHRIPGTRSGVPSEPVASVPPPAGDVRGALTGTWSGTWGGTPLTLALLGQGPMGLATGVAGVLTSTAGGQVISVNVQGWLGQPEQVLMLEADSRYGTQLLRLTRGRDDRLIGTGQSSFQWGPQGAVELTRQ